MDERLGRVAARLVAPEVLAAAECRLLWARFTAVLRLPKPALHLEAGRALLWDLEALAQRLDLPPLPAWSKLPEACDDAKALEEDDEHEPKGHSELSAVRRLARSRLARAAAGGEQAREGARLLGRLSTDERTRLFASLVGEGVLGRGDCTLVARLLARGASVGAEDQALVDVLSRTGAWLRRG